MSDYGKSSRRRLVPIVAAVVVGLGVVGAIVGVFLASRDNHADQRQTGGVNVAELQSQQASAPACADVFATGETVDEGLTSAGFMCRNPHGNFVVLAAFDCNDGTALWSVSAADAGHHGWGYSGKPFHVTTGPVASDAGYGKAYTACHS